MNDGPRFIIALEGLPGSGKTTLVNLLRQRLSTSLRTVPQIIYSGKRRTQFSVQYYLENDVRKCARAERFKAKGFSVIMDRCVLSTLAYTATLDKFKNTKNYQYVVSQFFQFVRKGKLNLPDICIYIKITPATSVARKRRNRRHYYVWNDQQFLRTMDRHSQVRLRSFKCRAKFINGNQSFSKVLSDVRSVVTTAIKKA